ncbi:hypothetical protein [Nonomuraea sp. NPDC003214]
MDTSSPYLGTHRDPEPRSPQDVQEMHGERRAAGWSSSWAGRLARRWPTALALAASAATFGGSATDEGVWGLAHALMLLPTLYLVMAKLRQPALTWIGLVVGLVTTVGLRMTEVVTPSAAFAMLALAVLVWSGVDGQLRRDGTFRAQAVGMLVFGGLAVAALLVDPAVGRYLVAAGWFFHGVWDFAHLRLNRPVARSFAEWCGVVDVLVALQVLFML